jgi:hypothetical protein
MCAVCTLFLPARKVRARQIELISILPVIPVLRVLLPQNVLLRLRSDIPPPGSVLPVGVKQNDDAQYAKKEPNEKMGADGIWFLVPGQ